MRFEEFLISSEDHISASVVTSDDLTERIYLAGQANNEATIATVDLSGNAISQPRLIRLDSGESANQVSAVTHLHVDQASLFGAG